MESPLDPPPSVGSPEFAPPSAPAYPSSEEPQAKGPWGGWSSLGLSTAIYAVASMAGVVFAGAMIALFNIGEMTPFNIPDLTNQNSPHYGDFLTIATLVTALVGCPLLWLAASVRAGSKGAFEYLGLNGAKWGRAFGYVIAAQAVTLAWGAILSIFGNPNADTFIDLVIGSASSRAMLILGIVFAPAFLEEFIFRGFLMRGLMESRLGPIWALIITSLVFAAIHIQYDLLNLSVVFVLALSLGFVRLKTGSLWPCIILHAINNAIAIAASFWG